MLLESNIRMWVLTGDKKETALNIGRSCKLIEEVGKNEINLTTDKDYLNSNEIIQKLDYEENRFVIIY